jgi:hypothetical protein
MPEKPGRRFQRTHVGKYRDEKRSRRENKQTNIQQTNKQTNKQTKVIISRHTRQFYQQELSEPRPASTSTVTATTVTEPSRHPSPSKVTKQSSQQSTTKQPCVNRSKEEHCKLLSPFRADDSNGYLSIL